MIITNKSKLETPCEIVSIKEGEEIAVRILHELRNSKIKGVGLAANQIGINKRVCVVNVKEPIVLINPKIVEKSEETFIFPEGCLSFPKKYVRTLRHTSVTVEADNHNGKLYFTNSHNFFPSFLLKAAVPTKNKKTHIRCGNGGFKFKLRQMERIDR